MIERSSRSVIATACLLALVLGAGSAAAQITTGTVLGNVKDSTGGVVPGATVVLTSETRGTKSVPAVTNASGDYVFPNVTADTYTVEVTMDGFKTVKRTGVQVSGADRVAVPGLTLEPGGAAETVNVTSEAPLIQASSGERSFAVSQVADREPSGEPPGRRLHELHVVHARRHRRRRVGGRHAARRRRPEQHHDGRHLGHGHRQQRPDAEHERRVDRRGQGPDPGLPGGIRTVERSADHRRHQERHQPLPRVGLRLQDQLGLEREHAGGKRRTATRSRSTSATSGATRSAARLASPAATTNSSSSTRTSIVRPTRRSTTATRFVCGVPTAAERAGDFSQTLTTTATCSTSSETTRATCRVLRRTHDGCFQDGGVIGRIPASRLYQTGHRGTEPLPDAEHHAGAGHELQLRGRGAGGEGPDAAAGDPPRLPDVAEVAGDWQVLGPAGAPLDDAGLIQGFTDVLNPEPVHHELRHHRQLFAQPRRPSSKARTGSSATSWWAVTKTAC